MFFIFFVKQWSYGKETFDCSASSALCAVFDLLKKVPLVVTDDFIRRYSKPGVAPPSAILDIDTLLMVCSKALTAGKR